MNQITTTPASSRGQWAPSGPLRRLMISVTGAVSAMVLATGAAVGAFAPAANADVNTQGLWAWASMSDCTIHIGDQYSRQGYAIGDTTVYCSSYHNISVYTQLYRRPPGGSYTLVATSFNPYSTFWNTRIVHDVPTAPVCGGPDVHAWYTLSWVSIDGSAWRSFTGPQGFWPTSC
jgi:hypothetical protein